MEFSGEAHISSMVAAYEVGTLTSKLRPVASLRASAISSPPLTMTWASTDGTKSTLMGFSSLPTSLAISSRCSFFPGRFFGRRRCLPCGRRGHTGAEKQRKDERSATKNDYSLTVHVSSWLWIDRQNKST